MKGLAFIKVIGWFCDLWETPGLDEIVKTNHRTLMATGLRFSARTLWHLNYNQLTWDCLLHLSKGFQYTIEKYCDFLGFFSRLEILGKNLLRMFRPSGLAIRGKIWWSHLSRCIWGGGQNEGHTFFIDMRLPNWSPFWSMKVLSNAFATITNIQRKHLSELN